MIELPATPQKLTEKIMHQYRHTWTVFYGVKLTDQSCRVFHAEHLAEQFLRALQINGTPCVLVNTQERI